MRRICLLTAALLTVLCGGSYSSEITLRGSFFGGWKYAVDGGTFHSIGSAGDSIYHAMEGNAAAQNEVLKYRSGKRWSNAVICGCAAAIGFTIISRLSSDDWEKKHTVLLVSAVPMSLLAISLEKKASEHLKKAVGLYNGQEQVLRLDAEFRPGYSTASSQVRLGLSLHF